MPPPSPTRARLTRLLVASIAFVIGAAAIIVLVTWMYLLPAYEAWVKATPRQRGVLSAHSALLLAVVLVVLFLLLIAVFGVRRYFVRREELERTKTQYIDAWAEAGRRIHASNDE